MPTPLERLQKIIAAQIPSHVVYVPDGNTTADTFLLKAVIVSNSQQIPIPDDAALQAALKFQVQEIFQRNDGIYKIDANPERLWSYIRHKVSAEYNSVSPRCEATKRKTTKFINSILLDNVHLANYVIQVFLKIQSTADVSDYEAFETLRRSYGKRTR